MALLQELPSGKLLELPSGLLAEECCCDCLEYTLAIVATPDGCCCFDFSTTMDPAATTTIASYEWDFGDGSTSTSATPSHCYEEAGDYTVTLTTVDAEGCTKIVTEEVSCTCPEGEEPVADFSYVQTDDDPCCLSFTNDSTVYCDRTATYLWDFGDGDTSTSENPSHCYDGEGPWDVTLTVTDSAGCTDSVVMEVDCVDQYGGECCYCLENDLPATITATFGGFPGGCDLDGSATCSPDVGNPCLYKGTYTSSIFGTMEVEVSLGTSAFGASGISARHRPNSGGYNWQTYNYGNCPNGAAAGSPQDCETWGPYSATVLTIVSWVSGGGGWGCGTPGTYTPTCTVEAP